MPAQSPQQPVAQTPKPTPSWASGWLGSASDIPIETNPYDLGRTMASPKVIYQNDPPQPTFSNNTMIQPSSINPNPGSDTPTVGRITPKSPGVNTDVNRMVPDQNVLVSKAPTQTPIKSPAAFGSYNADQEMPSGLNASGTNTVTPSQYVQETIAAPSNTQAELDTANAELAGLERTEATNANVRGVANVAASAISESSRAAANMASIEHANDMEQWKQSGAYWFDPNSDLKPDLDAYLAKQPSKFESIKKGTLTGQSWTTGKGGKRNIGGTIGTGILNPFGGSVELMGGEKYSGFAEYSGNKAGERALQGLGAGGWIGAIAGAVVGCIEGTFAWNSAKAEDQKNKAAARDEYMMKLKEWQYNKNKTRAATIMAQRQQAAAYEAARANKKVASRKNAQADQRAAFLSMINQAAQNKQANIKSLQRTR